MTTARAGTIHGNTITLDAEVPPLEGRRVRVVIEPLDAAEVVLSPDQQAQLWQAWARSGPQGPIDEDEESEFP
jgi:hypothetical protein